MTFYESVMKSDMNLSRNGGQNYWFLGILLVYSLMFIIMQK